MSPGPMDHLFSSEVYTVASKLLDATALRQRAIAANIANVNTPGYHRQDITLDFETRIRRASEAMDLRAIRSMQPEMVTDTSARNSRPDGNNVQLEQELVHLNRNSLQYQMLAEWAGGSLKKLKTAITGKIA